MAIKKTKTTTIPVLLDAEIYIEKEIKLRRYLQTFKHKNEIAGVQGFKTQLVNDVLCFGLLASEIDLALISPVGYGYRKHNFIFEKVEPNVYEVEHEVLGKIRIEFKHDPVVYED